jgi:hypothetical protein
MSQLPTHRRVHRAHRDITARRGRLLLETDEECSILNSYFFDLEVPCARSIATSASTS